jgi:hypothetical protein
MLQPIGIEVFAFPKDACSGFTTGNRIRELISLKNLLDAIKSDRHCHLFALESS